MRTLIATLITVLLCAPLVAAPIPARTHHEAVQAVSGMVGDAAAQSLAGARGLQVLNVLWEDTGRYKGSSVGPNISDVTIEVQSEDQQSNLHTSLMPVIRFPNFHDRTADLRLDKLLIRVGNHRQGGRLWTVPLRTFLQDPSRFTSLPHHGTIRGGSLLAARDSHVLVSAQAAFLPIRSTGSTSFWPVIFNYQSTKGHPAVLTLLVTRQGTSMTIIDNSRDTVTGGRSWGQRLYFNTAGQRAPLTAERLSAVRANGHTANGESADQIGQDANLLMLIQVPLKVSRPRRYAMDAPESAPMGLAGAPAAEKSARSGGSDVEQAVLGHGPSEGPYTELDGLTIERDPQFPIRVTVQFYQATSNGVVSASDMEGFASLIEKVYSRGDFVGSLVAPGYTGRPTEWTGVTPPPPGLGIQDFPGLIERCYQQGKPCPPAPRWGFID